MAPTENSPKAYSPGEAPTEQFHQTARFPEQGAPGGDAPRQGAPDRQASHQDAPGPQTYHQDAPVGQLPHRAAPPGPASQSPPVARTGTIVWGLIAVVLGLGSMAVALGRGVDIEIALISLFLIAGLGLLVGSVISTAHRSRRSRSGR